MREVTVAQNAGFCFGVKRAADKIEKATRQNLGARIFTLGHLIHNDRYNRRLEAMGVRAVTCEEMEEIVKQAAPEEKMRLFVRAHGIPKETEEKLKDLCRLHSGFSYEDCTCPHVKKIHRIAEEHASDEAMFILFGDAKHPEVVGIMSYFQG